MIAWAAVAATWLALLAGAVDASAANPARHLLTRADLRGLHFGLTYGGSEHRADCRVASKYREAPNLDSTALANSVAFCRSVEVATAFYRSPLSSYDRCRRLKLGGAQEATRCVSTFGGGRLVIMRSGRRVGELTSDSPDVGGLSRRTLQRLARIQARRLAE
jgi:hypothetical protein